MIIYYIIHKVNVNAELKKMSKISKFIYRWKIKNIIDRSPSCYVILMTFTCVLYFSMQGRGIPVAVRYHWRSLDRVPRGVVGMQSRSAAYFLPFFYYASTFSYLLSLFLRFRYRLLLLFLTQAPCSSLLHNAVSYIEYFAVVKW